MVYMTKVGEDTGKLEDVMRGMGTYYDREASMKAEIKSAVTFPIVLFAMMSVIMLVLVFKINPMFKNMFSELASDTAQVSSRMMNIGTVVGRVCSIIIIAVLILIVALFAVTKTKKGGSLVDTFLIKFKPTRRLSSMMVKSKFMSAMTLMVQSGMPLDQALEATMDGASGSAKDEIKEAARLMKEENLSLDEALLKTNIITGMDNKMIAIALKAGVSDEAFAKLSDRYNEEVGEALMGISTKVETTLVIILALMVGIVLVSVMLPLVSLIGSIQ
jgi:type IV pilus assembly protein PilC